MKKPDILEKNITGRQRHTIRDQSHPTFKMYHFNVQAVLLRQKIFPVGFPIAAAYYASQHVLVFGGRLSYTSMLFKHVFYQQLCIDIPWNLNVRLMQPLLGESGVLGVNGSFVIDVSHILIKSGWGGGWVGGGLNRKT